MINRLMCLLISFFVSPIIARTQVRPIKIEEKTVIANSYSSKYGVQKHLRHHSYIVYNDGTRTSATARKLKPIAFETTLGAYKWRKWQQSTHRQWLGVPIIATGFVGLVMATQPTTRTQGALIGTIGLASGIWTISHFEFKKQKYLRSLIDFCNKQFQTEKTFETAPAIQPDVLKIGFQGTPNSIGLGVNWTF
jgi:hypothetical protein